MSVSSLAELIAFAALVGGTDRLLGLGPALLVLGVVLLVIGMALENQPIRLPRRQRRKQPKPPPGHGPHPPLMLNDKALDAAETAYESAVRRIAAEHRQP